MKKAKFAALLLVLAFALMGAAFAAWTETLNINGSVATGNLDVAFSSATSNDPQGTNDPDQNYDVGVTTATISDDQNTLTITAANTYPGYTATVTYKVKNTGSIPVKLTGVTVNNSHSQITVSATQPNNAIIPVGGEWEGTITHTVNDNAAENATYTYTATVNAVQFNQ
ncbi:hypothetical protein [Desulfovirgula thermocuniculi]|uniref:hypothetical protein n=1 Tax=Desulfovirgula thermocuniculi TaxID=348842 RepID=UPI0003FD7FF1|nr:hypothetical protein [Desulfovirgula thermocuniculi]